jgi:D-alanyl-D-alanine carboxypeptidase (penicillin-binding protein 5/6)
VLLVDLSSDQVLCGRNADKSFLPASMTKAMTALVAFDLIRAGKVTEESPITVAPETAQRWAGKGSTLSLRAGERLRYGELLLGTTAVSANDAAVALAQASAGSTEAFVAQMNRRAARLGMKSSHFASPNGYPDQGRTKVSASDLVLLAWALTEEHPGLYRRYFGRPTMLWRGSELRNRDPITGTVPGADGIKTGHTHEAGFNFLGSAQRGNRRLVLVIGGAASEEARASVARELVEWGFTAWRSKPLAPPGWIAGEARVQNGTVRSVPLVLEHSLAVSLPVDSDAQVTARIRYLGPLRAPVASGTVAARLELSAPGLAPWSVPLVAGRQVDVAGPFDRIVNGLLGIAG